MGDWLLYGQAEYPDRYRHAISQTSLDYQTLRNYAWVARRFQSHERVSELSLQHHAEVASLSPEDRSEWLRQAVEQGWSRNELRRQVKARKEIAGTYLPGRLNLCPNDLQRQHWQQAAEHAGVELLTWITAALDDAS